MKILDYIFCSLFFLIACSDGKKATGNGAFKLSEVQQEVNYDFNEIQQSGELIVGTLSGPDSYFEYQGKIFGLQYALISHFAQKNGLRVRIELAQSVEQLVELLQSHDIDVICYLMDDQIIQHEKLVNCGFRNDSLHTSWAVRADVPILADALNAWQEGGYVITLEKKATQMKQQQRRVRRKMRAPYLDKKRGIISQYDSFFKNSARIVGWDWRLIAALSYQESGYDPKAESWAGAKGLMQLMPNTAEHLGLPVHHIYDPQQNIAAGVRYLKELSGQLSDVKSPQERIKFVLAAYNGGLGHVRDAMALARKYGRNSQRWEDVSSFILQLSEPRYYRDPVVKHGYMIGRETYDYVYSICDRWLSYGGGSMLYSSHSFEGKGATKRNRFSKEVKIYSPEDSLFHP